MELDLQAAEPVLEGLLAEGEGLPAKVGRKPATHENSTWSSANRMGKLRYTHDAMIDLIITNPGISQGQLAIKFGFSEGWVSNVIASDAFQAMMAKRREEIVDPQMRGSIEELFKGLVRQSLAILQKKLEEPNVPANVALRAAELGAKAMGLGGHAPVAAPPVDPNRLVDLAQRLVDLNRPKEREVNGQVIEG